MVTLRPFWVKKYLANYFSFALIAFGITLVLLIEFPFDHIIETRARFNEDILTKRVKRDTSQTNHCELLINKFTIHTSSVP